MKSWEINLPVVTKRDAIEIKLHIKMDNKICIVFKKKPLLLLKFTQRGKKIKTSKRKTKIQK